MKAKVLIMASCLLLPLTIWAQELTTVKKEQKQVNGKTVTIYSTIRNGETKIDSMYIDKAENSNTSSLVLVQNNGETILTELPKDLPVLNCEVMPEYPGGMTAMMAFIIENMKYPEDAKKADMEGRVVCSFVINKEGKVSEAHVIQSAGFESLDNEALRLVNLMPDWTPGMQDGKPVQVLFTIPILFKLK